MPTTTITTDPAADARTRLWHSLCGVPYDSPDAYALMRRVHWRRRRAALAQARATYPAPAPIVATIDAPLRAYA